MKWITLSPIFILLTACSCCTNKGAPEYRQVSYTPRVVVTPIYYDPATIVAEDPTDVTTTTIDFY